MKVLHLIQRPQLRGAEIFTFQLAAHINQKGHDAFVVGVFEGSNDLPFNNKLLLLKGNPKRRFWDFKAWKELYLIIKEEQPDIIQANAGDTLKYAVFSKLIFGWKQPILFRNASTISLYIKTRLARTWNSFFFKYATRIISVSKASAKDFARLFPHHANKINTIPVGIEPNSLNVSKGLTKEELFGCSGPVLVHVAGFTYEKNHIGLIRIFESLLQKIPVASLHLIGNGPLKMQIEEIVRMKGLESKIKFYGFQPNALQYIKAADVLLLPSIIEGLPGVILEAFISRTPVVAYNVGGISEILINNETGRLVKKENESAFVEAVIESMENSEQNLKLVENAFRIASREYQNSEIANLFIKVYQEVLKDMSRISLKSSKGLLIRNPVHTQFD